MGKIGILTLFHSNYNYGAHLQAYALQEKLRQQNIDTEIIDFDWNAHYIQENKYSSNIIGYVKKVLLWTKNKLINSLYQKKFASRKDAFEQFDKTYIKTSKELYTTDNICEADKKFSAFITGSDQVWRLINRDPIANDVFFLKFTSKLKMAYSASLGINQLKPEHIRQFKSGIENIDFVSVRETSAKKLLNKFIKKPIKVVADPTLLLTKIEWDNIAESVNISGDYIFCYFLGNSKWMRERAEEIAKEKKYKLVCLPNLLLQFRRSDFRFKSLKLYDVSPRQFIALIKNAKIVLTDSFHAMIFSTIYHKEFYIFNREESSNSAMILRISDFLDATGLRNQFICKSDNIIEHMQSINTFKTADEYVEALREQSLEFLYQIKETICIAKKQTV